MNGFKRPANINYRALQRVAKLINDQLSLSILALIGMADKKVC
jgi:hypothetical protein